ncbi:hypothetical protein V8F06_007836 [Rhypophila decipiens]
MYSGSAGRTGFLSLPGLCTGDLWHTAAAALLLNHWPNGPLATDDRYFVLITLPEDTRQEVINGRVSAMYNYLKNLGIICVVAKLPAAGPSADDAHCECAAARISHQQMDDLVVDLFEIGAPTIVYSGSAPFQAKWTSLRTVQLLDSAISSDGGYHILPPVHHYAATPILAAYFSQSLTETHSYLRRTMSGKDVTLHQDAEQKVQALRELISKKRRDAGAGFENARAILFIYRAIDGSGDSHEFVMNPHQNTSRDLFYQVRKAAYDHGLVTIRVPHGLSADSMSPTDDLDLFGVMAGSTHIKDKRFTASFWEQVYDHVPEVFGACGGRTGSLDIAAFMGVNCFEWDEPLLHEMQRGRLSEEHLEKQVPQHLRLLTQRSFMSIGLLDGDSFVQRGGGKWKYTRLDQKLLERWLVGERDVFPELVGLVDGETSRAVREGWAKYFERTEDGLVNIGRGAYSGLTSIWELKGFPGQ